jgi:hypothetical protein
MIYNYFFRFNFLPKLKPLVQTGGFFCLVAGKPRPAILGP